MISSKKHHSEFERLVEVIEKLRNPESGCPWDLKQTHETLLKYLLEESYEFIHAVENEPHEMEEELGDILLQVLLHSQIASESKRFNIESVSKKLADKMIRRHPHVFSKKKKVSTDELTDEYLQRNWDHIKKEEAKEKTSKQTLELLPHKSFHGPALSVSSKIGKKTKEFKFDWNDIDDVADKVEEEWQEVKVELAKRTDKNKNIEKIQEEIGDLLLSIAQLSRHIGVDPEQTLKMANQKFLKRFNSMNEIIEAQGQNILELEQCDLENYWREVKKNEAKL